MVYCAFVRRLITVCAIDVCLENVNIGKSIAIGYHLMPLYNNLMKWSRSRVLLLADVQWIVAILCCRWKIYYVHTNILLFSIQSFKVRIVVALYAT